MQKGPDRISPVFPAGLHRQPRRRPGIHQVRLQGAQPGQLHRLRHRHPCHRRFDAHHPARRCRHHDRRRGRVPRSRRWAWPDSRPCAPSPPATTSRKKPRGRSTRTATGSSSPRGRRMLVLEELEHAVKRGAQIYAEVVGYGFTGDAFHMTAPDPDADGAFRAMKHGRGRRRASSPRTSSTSMPTAHRPNSTTSWKHLPSSACSASTPDKLAISSTKSMTGHMLGATGSAEAAFTVLAIVNSFIPPTINYETPDPECDLNYTPNQGVAREIPYALSNSFGFGGTNATLAFKKWTGTPRGASDFLDPVSSCSWLSLPPARAKKPPVAPSSSCANPPCARSSTSRRWSIRESSPSSALPFWVSFTKRRRPISSRRSRTSGKSGSTGSGSGRSGETSNETTFFARISGLPSSAKSWKIRTASC